MILRPGYINQNMIQEVIGEVRMDQALIDEHSSVRPKAPGMKYRHYAPRHSFILWKEQRKRCVKRLTPWQRQEERRGRRAGVIVTEESVPFYHHGILKVIGSRGDELSISRHLFGILREFDEMDVQVIYSEAFHTPRWGRRL